MSVDLFGQEATERRAMGSHQSAVGGSDEWLTPPWLLGALGPFDLDPCSPITRPWGTAAKHYTIEDDGLHVWPRASALLFLRGRLTFHHRNGRRADANSGAPSVLVAYGAAEAARLSAVAIAGQLVPLAGPYTEQETK